MTAAAPAFSAWTLSSTGIGDEVGDHGDAALGEDALGLGGGGQVGAFHDELGLDLLRSGAVDDVLQDGFLVAGAGVGDDAGLGTAVEEVDAGPLPRHDTGEPGHLLHGDGGLMRVPLLPVPRAVLSMTRTPFMPVRRWETATIFSGPQSSTRASASVTGVFLVGGGGAIRVRRRRRSGAARGR
jgi:hypothetical protein